MEGVVNVNFLVLVRSTIPLDFHSNDSILLSVKEIRVRESGLRF